MDYLVTHTPEGPVIAFYFKPDEAVAIHGDMRTTLHTTADYDEFDLYLHDALREVLGKRYRKGEK